MITRIAGWLLLVTLLIGVLMEIGLLLDLRRFELPYLFELLGVGGVALLILLHAGLAVVLRIALVAAGILDRSRVLNRAGAVILLLTAVGGAWAADWVLLERPFSAGAVSALQGADTKQEAQQLALRFAAGPGGWNPESSDPTKLAVMSARAAINHPAAFEGHPLGETVRDYGRRYDVEPTLLFAWLYLDSFYGEAAAGPMPFFRNMTGETFRDLVQVHLPAWFIESRTRAALINEEWLNGVAGPALGHKLRYALQKATYDVSVDPYDTNVLTDVLLVMRLYPDAFEDVLAARTPLDAALATSLREMVDVRLQQPCSGYYDNPTSTSTDYDAQREPIITFARAAFYKMLFDFGFATRVQALVAAHYSRLYQETLGHDVWHNISRAQRVALLAMLRDVYVPNIGRTSWNLYLLPEFNCAPFDFVSSEAAMADLKNRDSIWRPDNAGNLWAAAGYKMRNLAEVWNAAEARRFPMAEPPTDTVSQSLAVLARNRDLLESMMDQKIELK